MKTSRNIPTPWVPPVMLTAALVALILLALIQNIQA